MISSAPPAVTVAAANFGDQILRELVAAMGGALFVGNLMALVRRRRERDGSPAGDLERAPIARTVIYLVVGFVVMLWGVASILAA